MPGRTKVTKMIDELYEDMLKLKDMLKQSSSVSLTTEAAKMPTGDSYVATGSVQEIGSLIMELGIKYTLDDRLDAIATDNGANFVAAMEDLLENGICEEHYLAIPASSAPSEHVFSRAKLIQERQRWNLLPQRLEASIC
eukprot:Em0002g1092a